MGALRLVWAVLALVNKLLTMFGKWSQRRQIRKEFQNEQVIKQMQDTRRASKVRRDVRRAGAERPDQRLQDDGYRRD